MPDDFVVYKEYVANRGDFWIREHLSPFAAFRSKTDFFLEMDYVMQHMALQLRTVAARGENTDESRSVEKDVKTKVFATWLDHLKYDLKERRLMAWIPKWATGRLTIRYQEISTKFYLQVPVKVTKFCPHIEVDWKSRPSVHIAYLEPETLR